MKRKTWVALRSVLFGLVVIVVGWSVGRYFVRLRALGYADSAIGTMRTLAANENKFAESHPNLGYTGELPDISTDATIATGPKNGYIFKISDCQARGEVDRTQATA